MDSGPPLGKTHFSCRGWGLRLCFSSFGACCRSAFLANTIPLILLVESSCASSRCASLLSARTLITNLPSSALHGPCESHESSCRQALRTALGLDSIFCETVRRRGLVLWWEMWNPLPSLAGDGRPNGPLHTSDGRTREGSERNFEIGFVMPGLGSQVGLCPSGGDLLSLLSLPSKELPAALARFT